jgi:hypothetical protein
LKLEYRNPKQIRNSKFKIRLGICFEFFFFGFRICFEFRDSDFGFVGTKPMANSADKYYLWIDGVGGYLLCLANKITIGQATPEAGVDVPLFADISRHHATLTRDPEGYLLEAVRSVLVNDRQVDRALLHSGDRVTLGKSCQFLFSQPVAVSASAVMQLVSGHRLRVSVDSVLMMAESLVLGPGPQAHVVVPDLHQPLVLFRGKDGLGIHGADKMVIGGKPCRERGQIEPGCRVSGEDFSLGLELVANG